MSYISPINCENKENWDLLRILLSVVVQDEDGTMYLNTSGGGAITVNEISTSLTEGDNVFLLATTPSIVQIWSVDLVGNRTQINLEIEVIGTTLTVNSGLDYTNVLITYI